MWYNRENNTNSRNLGVIPSLGGGIPSDDMIEWYPQNPNVRRTIMEKKTIGKFISALRKANGMTQRELGEKLYVSDKTVSRWECDECTPELSLIPSIAEIFGISTDELLRGERNNPYREPNATEENTAKQKAKSDKQLKLLLDRNVRKYKNLTLLSVGITLFGFIAALVANLGFSKGFISFCLATTFGIASVLCQICFAINARITPDEDDYYTAKIQETNTNVITMAVVIAIFNIVHFAFCLPLITLIDGITYGLPFGTWLLYGLLFGAIALAVCYILYALLIRKTLVKKGVLTFTEKQAEIQKRKNQLLKKSLSTFAAIALFLGVCIGVWNFFDPKIFLKEYTFDNCTDFKEFMESDYDRWFTEAYGQVYVNGEIVEIKPGDPDYPHNVVGSSLVYGSLANFDGEEICYYYYNPDLYWAIDFTPSAEDRMPVTVITRDDVIKARSTYFAIETTLYVLIGVDFLVMAGFYLIKSNKRN